MPSFTLDTTHELASNCRASFPNLRSRLILSIGEWGLIHGSKTDYFTSDGKKLGFRITRHYDRKQLPIYNNKTRVYIYTGE
jgi:hypothetical protein